jgi:hypothetical protein
MLEGQKTPEGHPQKIMKNLGITYQYAVPQSLYDAWHFWNCKNVPEKLPPYLEIMDWNPKNFIGYGLSEEMAFNLLKGER